MFTKEQITNRVFSGDCLQIMELIPDKSIDMVLCDLPYGNGTTHCKWDCMIPFDQLWVQYKRIVKQDGAILLFGSGKFSYHVMNSNFKDYKYSYTWIKNNVSNFANSKKQPMRKYEQIHVFYRQQATYNPQGLRKIENPKVRQQNDCTIGEAFRCASLDKPYVQEYQGYPADVLVYDRDKGKSYHPTAKPQNLLQHLILTHSSPGDLILDNTCGAGSTLLAARGCGRNYVGIEKEERFLEIIKERLK